MAKRLTHSAEELDAAVAKTNENSEDIAELQTAVSGKADKLEGKQLSTNDYTDEDKAKLAELENYDDTALRESVSAAAEQAALNRSALGYQRKNLLKNTATSQTVNGITFTVNEDGSITANGTASANLTFTVFQWDTIPENLKNIALTLNGCPEGGRTDGYRLAVHSKQSSSAAWTGIGAETGAEMTFKFNDTAAAARIVIAGNSGTVFDNLTFYPMLRYAEITDNAYEPYKPSVEERLAALEARVAALEGGV